MFFDTSGDPGLLSDPGVFFDPAVDRSNAEQSTMPDHNDGRLRRLIVGAFGVCLICLVAAAFAV